MSVKVQQADREAGAKLLGGKPVGAGDGDTFIPQMPTLEAAAEAFAHHAEQARLEERRKRIDRDYMIDALVQMLGPKARRVWEMWQAQGVIRQHTSWGPNAPLHDGEAIAQCHLDMEAAIKTPVHDVDAHLAAIRREPSA